MIYVDDITTTIFCYDDKTGKKKYITNYSPLSEFRYAGCDFYVIETKTSYKVCIQASETELLSVWTHPKTCTEFEFKTAFQKGLMNHNIGKKEIELFKDNPKEYKKSVSKN